MTLTVHLPCARETRRSKLPPVAATDCCGTRPTPCPTNGTAPNTRAAIVSAAQGKQDARENVSKAFWVWFRFPRRRNATEGVLGALNAREDRQDEFSAAPGEFQGPESEGRRKSPAGNFHPTPRNGCQEIVTVHGYLEVAHFYQQLVCLPTRTTRIKNRRLSQDTISCRSRAMLAQFSGNP